MRMRRAVAVVVALLGPSPVLAQSTSAPCEQRQAAGSFVEVAVPGADETYITGINSRGTIVGAYSAEGATHGFILERGVFADVQIAGSSPTVPNDINSNGAVVGTYFDGSGYHGFILKGGQVTTLDPPGALATSANGINDAGVVVGTFLTPGGEDGIEHGFIYDDGTYTIVDYPGAGSTGLHDINNAGTVLGGAFVDHVVVFLYDAGTVNPLTPCVPGTGLQEITNSGRLLGSIPIGVNATAGVVVTGRELILVEAPGALWTVLNAGNANGTVTGRYQDANLVQHAFVFVPR
jgi:probable HAF family extracellular repeat protein